MLKSLIERFRMWATIVGAVVGVLTFISVGIQNLVLRQEIALQEQISDLKAQCSFYESTVEAVNVKFQYIEMRVSRLENGRTIGK